MISILRRLRAERPDAGYVLPMVLGLGLVMVMIVGTALTVTLSGTQKSYTDADWNAALAAAYAGVEDYKSRIQNDQYYKRYGNPDSPFSEGSTGLSLPTGSLENPAFNIAAGQPWATVPGSDGQAQFRYEVDNSLLPSTGVIRLRVTGKVGDATRSIIADLLQSGFTDYVYYTNYEVQDPQLTGKDSCAAYYWERPSSCEAIRFASNDNLGGKVHSNDRIMVCGSTFRGAVTTASLTNPLYAIDSGCADGKFLGGRPQKVNTIEMPPTNQEMRKEVRNDLPDEVPDPGCLYTGPTTIALNGDGTMTVYSPWTRFTNVGETKAEATNPTARCGTPGTGAGHLGDPGGARIPVLDHNLVYVQAVPTSTDTDPNAWASGTYPTDFACSGSGASQGWTFGSWSFPYRVPNGHGTTVESTPGGSTPASPAYGCRSGDIFVKGTLKGALTMTSENNVYVIGDVRYSNEDEDILGLVAQNSIFIWNPVSGNSNMLSDGSRWVYASMLSLQHTIQVQNYDKGGARGTLHVVGSMAQMFRGPVGTGTATSISTGYNKDYQYDRKLTYMSPPKYLTPTSTSFKSTQIAGVPAAFEPNGAPR